MLQLPWKQRGSALESELMTVSSFSILQDSQYVSSFSDAETKMNSEGKSREKLELLQTNISDLKPRFGQVREGSERINHSIFQLPEEAGRHTLLIELEMCHTAHHFDLSYTSVK